MGAPTYGLGGRNKPADFQATKAKRYLTAVEGKDQDFDERDEAGDEAVAKVVAALKARGVKHTVIGKKDPEQARGDIRLDNAAVTTHLEVKAIRNYDDEAKLYNIYMEMLETYLLDYVNPKTKSTAKAGTLELIGFVRQLDLDSRVINLYELGASGRWLVFSPVPMHEYMRYTKEVLWDRNIIDSRADQPNKKKVGLRLVNLNPETIEEDWKRSRLQFFAQLVSTKDLVRAIAQEVRNYKDVTDESAEEAYRGLCKNYYKRSTLDNKEWWTFPVSVRLPKGN